ncbi:MAG: HD-GYP domain-containing protein [Candidatus Bipolaricaulota bacterium]|nr:HD-GYP domain-containing protein [Candidatus Bipolaricaulota bacterium]MDW8151564.1 HD-GYP domain-containing protein [Candidatus Bipolaricaulota bacterium]
MANFTRKVWLYVFGIVTLGFSLTAWQLQGLQLSSAFILAWIILACLDFLCEVYEVELLFGHRTSAAIAVGVAAILIGGPKLALSVILTSSLFAEAFLRRTFMKKDFLKYTTVVLFNVTQLAISVVIAGLVFRGLGGKPVFENVVPPYKEILDFLRAGMLFLVYVATNAAIVAGVVHFSRGVNYWQHLWAILRTRYVHVFSLGVLAVLITILYSVSPWYAILMLSPLFVAQLSLREHMKLRQQARQAFEKIAKIVSARDPYIGVHSEEVADLAVKLAQALKLSQEEIEKIEAAARVHDLGKIAVPDAILLKPGPLDEKEWEIMKKHPVVSAEILEGLEIYKNCVDLIRHEHEHWDGSGYPDGLKGEEIPLGARIIAVADVWHALLSERPYRRAYTKGEARKIMQDMAGKVLDPKLVELFLKIVE